MNIPGLIEPILRLLPAPGTAGASSVIQGLGSAGDIAVVGRKLESHISRGISGLAGHAISSNVRDALKSTHAVVRGGRQLDTIAREAVAAIASTAGKIAFIARECFGQIVGALHGGMLLNPAGALSALLPIAMTHWRRAEAEIAQLGVTLRELTTKVKSTHIPTPRAEATKGGIDAGRAGAEIARPGGEQPYAGPHAVLNDHSATPAPSGAAERAVAAAKTALGTPYQWGGNMPGQGLDCSGLTQWAYKQAGIDLPRTADAQAIGPRIPQHQLRPGDLAVWDGHVAMVVGGGQMIEAGDPVQINPIRQDNIGMAFKGFYRPTAA